MVEWAKHAVELGAGEICLNAIDTDGVRNGYELEITLIDAFVEGHADAALIASMVHTDGFTCDGIKAEIRKRTTLPLR